MGVKKAKFVADLKKFARVGLDSSIVIYHLEDVEPYSDLTEAIFTAMARRSLTAILSTISVTELLVKPFAERQSDRVAQFETFIHSLPNAVLVPPDYAIAKEAARLRGEHGLRTPDALLLATALVEKAEAFLTNDRRLQKLKIPGLGVVMLSDYVS